MALIVFSREWHGFAAGKPVRIGDGLADVYVSQGMANYVEEKGECEVSDLPRAGNSSSSPASEDLAGRKAEQMSNRSTSEVKTRDLQGPKDPRRPKPSGAKS